MEYTQPHIPELKPTPQENLTMAERELIQSQQELHEAGKRYNAAVLGHISVKNIARMYE